MIAVAIAAGTLMLGSRERIALRGAAGVALCAQACFLLGLTGLLRPIPLAAVALLAVAGATLRIGFASAAPGAAARMPRSREDFAVYAIFGLAVFLLFLLALLPPLAFDETLYHLPFVRAFTHAGEIRPLPGSRFAVFPVLHELLCVPAFLLAGDAGTHLVALAEAIVCAALLVEWGGRYKARAGWLAAAIFFGSPIVTSLSTVLHVELALALFVAAGFYALDRERYALAGFFLGSACSVKYLGFYFAAAALAIVLARAVNRRRCAIAFLATLAAAALPMTIWIVVNTGNPVFPFFLTSSWTHALPPQVSAGERAMRMLRVMWDVTFARNRVGFQPPVTPLLIPIVLAVAGAAMRDVKARWLVLLTACYVFAFSFLPPRGGGAGGDALAEGGNARGHRRDGTGSGVCRLSAEPARHPAGERVRAECMAVRPRSRVPRGSSRRSSAHLFVQ